MALGEGVAFILSYNIILCTSIYPCHLSLLAVGEGSIVRSGNGSILCTETNGCTSLTLQSVQLTCEDHVYQTSVLQIENSNLTVKNSSFHGCLSSTDGAVIYAYGGATVSVTSSTFTNTTSAASGGAISVVGGVLSISASRFEACRAVMGGGAIYAGPYECYASKESVETHARVSSSSFEACVSGQSGGSVLFSGGRVYGRVLFSNFSDGLSMQAGGALSVVSSNVEVYSSQFANNSARGIGGGALYAQQAQLYLAGLTCDENTAEFGGGGVLYWSGDAEPNITVFCALGFQRVSVSNCTSSGCQQACSACQAGTYKSDLGTPTCTLCAAGKFSSQSESSRADACTSCKAGSYSTVAGLSSADSCQTCLPGTFSLSGATACSLCSAGSFSSSIGANSSEVCVSCNAGSYSSAQGASSETACKRCEDGFFSDPGAARCSMCVAGTYSFQVLGEHTAPICEPCKAGFFSAEPAASSSAACVLCLAGGYSLTGASTCTLCAAGQYSSVSGATKQRACISCDSGKYSEVVGASSSETCSSCKAGTYAGSKYFTYTMVESSTFSWNEAEAACTFAGGHLASIDSLEENEELLNMLPEGSDWWIGYYYNVTRGHWAWSDGSANQSYTGWAENNPKMNTVQYLCAELASYSTSFALSGGWFYYETVGGQVLSSSMFYSPAGSWYNNDCSNNNLRVNGYICSFSGASSCQDCTVGTYSSSIGASSPVACVACKAGTFTNGSGSSVCTACTVDNVTVDNVTFNCSQNISPRREHFERWRSRRKVGQGDVGSRILGQQFSEQREWQPKSTKPGFGFSVSPLDNHVLNQRRQNPDKDIFKPSSERTVETMEMTVSIGSICGYGNTAAFGNCLASSFNILHVSGLPTKSSSAYPGITFSFHAQKKDFYNQTIRTDSSSFLQVHASFDVVTSSDSTPPFPILGGSVDSLQNGVASFTISVSPIFNSSFQGAGAPHLSQAAYIYLRGMDSQSELNSIMESGLYELHFLSGSQICPNGFVFQLDDSDFSGSCVECEAGTYSVSPLASPSGQNPACFNCPVDGICKGGATVTFSVGVWVVKGGVYRLIECPAGQQLVDSIHGCQQNQYILSSNNSNFSCQTCPIGAVCNGIALKGLVQGSNWQADTENGRYFLVSCPAGYEKQSSTYDSQQCAVCPAGRYCLGGPAPSEPCPDSTFAPQGANSSKSCLPAVQVQVSSVLPINQASFTDAMQQKFVQALADSCDVSSDKVLIWSISSARRMSNGSAVSVLSRVATTDLASANSLMGKLTKSMLDTQLAWEGLPETTSMTSSILQTTMTAVSTQTNAILIGCLLGVTFISAVTIAGCYFFRRKDDYDPLWCKISEIRQELGITLKDGYRLHHESIPVWMRICRGLQQQSFVELQRRHLEAAALLSLEQDFSVGSFDEFCILLKVEMSIREPEYEDAVHSPYDSLKCWLLELSKNIISVGNSEQLFTALNKSKSNLEGQSQLLRDFETSAKLKFKFFADQVSKARIWNDEDKELFRQLQRFAKDEMDYIATMCDTRYAQLSLENAGQELLAYNPLADTEAPIFRQDHSEVIQSISMLERIALIANKV